ncbi:MAG: DUF190 domain-containing protein [Alphaproteobacteria bacterium]|nr:DUF190 domain-containing protein [Alphaproteobacteria bacterium]
MKRYQKKRIEIIIEAPMQARVTGLLDRMDATGYTVVPAIAGKGREGIWTREGQVSDASRMIMILCITDGAHVDEILDPLFELVSRHIGIVTVSDVEVFRTDHF